MAVSAREIVWSLRIQALSDADIEFLKEAHQARSQAAPSAYDFALSEALAGRGQLFDQARDMSRQGVSKYPANAFGWAHLAYLELQLVSKDGDVSPAMDALAASFEACPFCHRDLLRWRLSFVLSNWEQTPEPLRRAAFDGADFLRWWYLDVEYLSAAREQAVGDGVPFDVYRSEVKTSVRPWEVALPDEF